MRKVFFIVFVFFCILTSCDDSDKIDEEIAKITLELQIERFDKKFSETKPSELKGLKKEFPYLFPEQYSDSVWLAKMTDTLQLQLSSEVDVVFNNFEAETTDLELLFKHIKYHFPKNKVPKVVTVISDVQYDNRVVLGDTLLLLGLDNYLGASHKFYGGIQQFIAEGLDKKYIVSDVASAFAKRIIPRPENRTFLSKLIYFGKELYVKDMLIPFKPDEQKIGFSKEQMEWVKGNEEQMWRYFIDKELLYSTDNSLDARFLDPAPFSKFQLELIDNESPGRVGRYIGWQIVKSFMDNNEVTAQQLLNLSSEKIFKESKYKPAK